MTQEEKQLLLTDLCARLLYKPVCHAGKINHDGNLYFINIIYSTVAITSDKAVGKFETCPIVDVKPYLRPMSSMTQEEIDEYDAELGKDLDIVIDGALDKDRHITSDGKHNFSKNFVAHFGNDWLDKKGFDYRGLIPMGLALEAPEGMYKTE